MSEVPEFLLGAIDIIESTPCSAFTRSDVERLKTKIRALQIPSIDNLASGESVLAVTKILQNAKTLWNRLRSPLTRWVIAGNPNIPRKNLSALQRRRPQSDAVKLHTLSIEELNVVVYLVALAIPPQSAESFTKMFNACRGQTWIGQRMREIMQDKLDVDRFLHAEFSRKTLESRPVRTVQPCNNHFDPTGSTFGHMITPPQPTTMLPPQSTTVSQAQPFVIAQYWMDPSPTSDQWLSPYASVEEAMVNFSWPHQPYGHPTY